MKKCMRQLSDNYNDIKSNNILDNEYNKHLHNKYSLLSMQKNKLSHHEVLTDIVHKKEH